MSLQLTYALSTLPNPLTVGTTAGMLTLMATNNSRQPVSIQGISLSIPVGKNGNELTGNPGQINSTTPQGWEAKSNAVPGTYTFVFTPHTTPYAVPAGSSLVFVLGNISVNNQQGTADLTITEGSDGNPTEIKHVSKFPAGWGAVNFTATLPDPPNPGNATLSWQGPEGADYNIQYFDYDTHEEVNIPAPGDAPLAYAGTYPGENDPPLAIDHTTLFTLTVSEVIDGRLYETDAQQTLEVYVPPPPPEVTSFTGQITNNNNKEQLLLTWSTKNAGKVEADWTTDLQDPNPGTPSVILPPFRDSYTIRAVNGDAESKPASVQLQWKLIATLPVGTGPAEIAIMPDSGLAFITNPRSNNVSVIDLSQLAIAQTIAAGNTPVAINSTPNGQYVCVGNFDNNLLVIDTGSFNIVQTIGLNYSAGYIACLPGSQLAWVLVDEDPPGNISVVNIATGAIVQNIKTGNGPHGLAVTPGASYALVVNGTDNNVTVINTETMQVVQTIGTDTGPTGIAITPDGKHALTPNMGSTTVSLLDLQQMNNIQNIQVGYWPRRVAITPDGTLAFSLQVYPDDFTVSVIDIKKATAQTFGLGSSSMNDIAISQDSRFAFISYDTSSVAVYDIQKQTVRNTITAGNGAANIAITPDGRYVLVLNQADDTVSVIGLTL